MINRWKISLYFQVRFCYFYKKSEDEEQPIVADEELKLETLISDYVQKTHQEFTKDDFRNLRIADIIAAVDTESGNPKANKKNKRKPSRPKISTKQVRSAQPPGKKKKSKSASFFDLYLILFFV